MTVRELVESKEMKGCADYELYQNAHYLEDKAGFHSDRIEWIDSYSNSFFLYLDREVIEYTIMDKEEYSQTIDANSSISSWRYEDDDKIMIIKIEKQLEEEDGKMTENKIISLAGYKHNKADKITKAINDLEIELLDAFEDTEVSAIEKMLKYKRAFPSVLDYNIYQYGNIRPYDSDIADFFAEHDLIVAEENQIEVFQQLIKVCVDELTEIE